MGVKVETHERTDDELYVFVLNGIGEKYTVLFEEAEPGYRLGYILLPSNDWTVDDFQETMEVRDESFSYVRTELGEGIDDEPMSMQQIVPPAYWEETGADIELIESTNPEPTPED